MRRIYMDHNATTPVHPEVGKAIQSFFYDKFGNPSSLHQFGREARIEVEKARQQIAKLIGAQSDEIYFTAGGTESDNWAIKGVADALKEKGNHIITSKIEHHAVLKTCEYLEKNGFKVTYIPVDNRGLVDPVAIEKAITNKTILISIMYANNEVGTIEPIEEIGKIAKLHDIYFHTDAVQSVGKIPVDVKKLNVDLLTLSGHKIYAPKGIGVLYIRKGTKITPLFHGGHHERNLRAGTENVPAIIGLGCAAQLAMNDMEQQYQHLSGLTTKLYNGITEKIDHVYVNGDLKQRLPGTLSISFEYVEGESVILDLDLKGIAVSSGSACTSGTYLASHVLLAMGVPEQLAYGSIRFSLGRDNTESDIDYLLEILPDIIKRLRDISPLYVK